MNILKIDAWSVRKFIGPTLHWFYHPSGTYRSKGRLEREIRVPFFVIMGTKAQLRDQSDWIYMLLGLDVKAKTLFAWTSCCLLKISSRFIQGSLVLVSVWLPFSLLCNTQVGINLTSVNNFWPNNSKGMCLKVIVAVTIMQGKSYL